LLKSVKIVGIFVGVVAMTKCTECGRNIRQGGVCPECEKDLKKIHNIVVKKELDRKNKKLKYYEKNMVERMAELFEVDSE
jgi:predicted amidophosphoribosyltransferase